MLDYINSFDTEGNVGRYMKQAIMYDILSGDYKSEELDEVFLDNLRSDMSADDEVFMPIK